MSKHDLSGFEFVRFDLRKDHHLLPSLIQCYQRVFAGEPWNEWLKCEKCEQVYGLDKPELLLPRNFMCCGKRLTEHWSAWQIVHDLEKEIISGSSCWLTVKRGTVVGFCWGYPLTPEKLEAKVKLHGIAETVRKKFGVDSVAYQDDLGILPEYRGQGIARAMFMKRHQDFRAQGLEIGVVRTKHNPPSVTYGWFTDEFKYETIAAYKSVDGRVILARNISTLFQEGA